MNVSLEVIYAIGGVIFAAGGLVGLLRLLRKDVDGLGGRVRQESATAQRTRFRTALLLVANEDDRKKREWLAERLLSE